MPVLQTLTALAFAADQPQWGQRYTRNMVSSETGLVDSVDLETGKNIKWIAELGARTYGTPVVAGGKVLIGTNNERPRDDRHKGDRGILLCLAETDGSLCWQLVVPKVGGDDRYLDWPKVGVCSPPTVEGDRVYVVSNRGEVLCLDLNGQTNGNQGYQGEARFSVPSGEPPIPAAERDADILWVFDMPAEVDIHTHDSAHASILIDGRFLYLNTGNGVDNTHAVVRKPDAPSVIVLDKATGQLSAHDEEYIGRRLFHCTWSSPALAEVVGRPLLFHGGADGVCYAFEAVPQSVQPDRARTLKKVWSFDCDPTAPKEERSKYLRNQTVSPSVINSMPVYHDGRLYVSVGGDVWWGKRQSWLKCLDVTGRGDVTETAQVWSYPIDARTCSTPAVHNGLVFLGDCAGRVHCVDARTGKPHWVHQVKGAIWGSTLVADGKVYVGTRKNQLLVLAASRDRQVIGTAELDGPIHGTPTAANGVLYVATMRKLYAFGRQSR